MRVWDIPISQLCNKHLVAQHFEIHCIHSIILKGVRGYANHPEVKRWKYSIDWLKIKHHQTAFEMVSRGFNHKSDLDIKQTPNSTPPLSWQPVEKQIQLIKEKGCNCKVL